MTSCRIPSTVTVALGSAVPSTSLTTPFIPRCTCTGNSISHLPELQTTMSSFTISTGRSSFRQHFKTTVMKILGESVSHLFDEGQQSLAVALPLERKFTFMWKLVTAQEDGQLEAVGVQVAEVIHTCERGSQVEDKECRLLFPPLNFYPHCVNTYCPPLASSWLCWRCLVPQ